MELYGLTGGSGAGKSAAAGLFAAHGFGWVDADAVYRGLCVPGSPLLAALCDAFGDVLTPAGALDRPKLAQIVFADRAQLAKLNAVTNPRIWEASRAACEALAAQGTTRILYDAPTLLQAGFDRHCTAVIGVIAPRNIRLTRIMARDGISAQAAAARIDAQPADAFYRARCQYILENTDGLSALREKVDALVRLLDEAHEPTI